MSAGSESTSPQVGWAVSGSSGPSRWPQIRWGRWVFIAALVAVNSVALGYIIYVVAGNGVPPGNRDVLLTVLFWGAIGSNAAVLIIGGMVRFATKQVTHKSSAP